MKPYTAQIVHTENSIIRLMECQDKICHPVLNLICSTGSVLLVVLAIMLQSKIGRISTIILSFLGCWFFMINRHRPKQLAEEAIKQLNGRMPTIKYAFTDKGICVTTDGHQETIPYNQITRLVEDGQYGYFFYQNKAAFIFEKSTADNLPELKEFLKDNVHLNWTGSRYVFQFPKKRKE